MGLLDGQRDELDEAEGCKLVSCSWRDRCAAARSTTFVGQEGKFEESSCQIRRQVCVLWIQ